MTHFKTENGASVQLCSQSNLVILPSSLTLMMLRWQQGLLMSPWLRYTG